MSEPKIQFHSECDFNLTRPSLREDWLSELAEKEGKKIEAVNYIFCDDEYLHKVNVEFLNHDNYTDIITFDYGIGAELVSDIFVSVERVQDNAKEYRVAFEDELDRVLAHGILHLCGYKDKTPADEALMREKENYYLSLRP
ncbi:MAG: rRNA maturation RNase YbeY [Flavobacteriales bacterium]|nr:rRNA maturation RNase YbeY [Flavobacteriales bacterium]